MCYTCDEYLLDDEKHFVFDCECNVVTRTNWFTKLHNKHDVNVYADRSIVMKEMLSMRCLKVSARYIEEMWEERKEVMYSKIILE